MYCRPVAVVVVRRKAGAGSLAGEAGEAGDSRDRAVVVLQAGDVDGGVEAGFVRQRPSTVVPGCGWDGRVHVIPRNCTPNRRPMPRQSGQEGALGTGIKYLPVTWKLEQEFIWSKSTVYAHINYQRCRMLVPIQDLVSRPRITMTTNFVRRSTRILVLNPNSSASMTHGVEEAIRGMNLALVQYIPAPSR